MSNRRTRWAWILPLLAAGGCIRPVLTAEDIVVRPDGVAVLVAHLEGETWPGLRKDLRGQVRFFVDKEPLGEARAAEGQAAIECVLPDSANRYVARSSFLGFRQQAAGRVFRWRADRPVLVVDIDDTICDTDHDDVIFKKRDLDSSPIGESQPILAHLAGSFQIAYLTARPRFLFEKTKIWLSDHQFPHGPVFVAPGLRRMMRATDYKTAALRKLRSLWPNVAIGIGDSVVDAHAYTENEMLTLIIADEPDEDLGPSVIVLRDWAALSGFFVANHKVLTDRALLDDVLRNGGSFAMPYVPAGAREVR